MIRGTVQYHTFALLKSIVGFFVLRTRVPAFRLFSPNNIYYPIPFQQSTLLSQVLYGNSGAE